ncbi:uncharacterized protein LOC142333143 [Lycorma delicatula]|uniref:uncharacterized protein LOC142333143 n=1 Tax=Lycorma delicatula TaxID=130591 RepID=UPI003F50DF55
MESYDLNLKNLVRNIHQHHLSVIQKRKHINMILSVSLLVFNQLVCLHCSVILYCLFQKNSVSRKEKHVMAYLSSLTCYGMICVFGQQLINESEDLWNSITLCSWLNKPLWFKQSIKIFLIATMKPLKLEPAGLYRLDLNFFLKLLQVSYSYCNLMLQFSNKKNNE